MKKVDWIFLTIIFCLLFFLIGYSSIEIEHEETIQKALECGYQPVSIGGYYWNKGD